MRKGHRSAMFGAGGIILSLLLTGGVADARQHPDTPAAVPLELVRAHLTPVALEQTQSQIEYQSPAGGERIARLTKLTPQYRIVKPAKLAEPMIEWPSVVALKGAPQHAPVRFNAMPAPHLQAASVLMPETKPFLFSTHGLGRQTGCLALAIYYEARSEDELGQIAVAQVILNRVKSRKYPDTICRVVFQNAHWRDRCQFSFACDGRIENPRHRRAWTSAIRLAKDLNCAKNCRRIPRQLRPLNRLSNSLRRATHYHADYVSPGWASRLERAQKIGRHIFYISRRVWS